MIGIIIGFVLVLLGLFALALQRLYSSVPAHELKRLAARKDHLAAALYRPVAFGASLRLLLWSVFVGATASGLLFVCTNAPAWLGFIAVTVALTGVVYLSSLRLTVHSARLAVSAAPALHKILERVHGPLNMVARAASQHRQHEGHSGLYEKDDLLALLAQQKDQLDNRISHHELETIERAARFSDTSVADIVLPWNEVTLVDKHEHVGPILLDRLHKSGQTSFIVYDGTPEHVAGTLFLRDAVHAKAGGTVGELMHARVCFVHEDFNLRQVFHAFTSTGQFAVVVVNASEEAVGVITLHHLLSQLIAEQPDDDLAFEDRTAVAAFRPQPQLEPVEVPVADDTPEITPAREDT